MVVEEYYGTDNENGKKPYAEIAELLPKDAILGGVNSAYPILLNKLQALSKEAKNMLITLGMIPKDDGFLIWLGLTSNKNIPPTPITQITITDAYLRKHYGE